MRTQATALAVLILAAAVVDAEDAGTRLLRQPDLSDTRVVFAHGGDLWVAERDGGAVRRLTTSVGVESEPHFSPDGRLVAFTGEYDGNVDVFVVPTAGGEPERLTWHPGADLVRGWTPDGAHVLFVSNRTEAPADILRMWSVAVTGGPATPLPLPRVARGELSDDGGRLVYQEIEPWESEWRNYRGGQNGPVRVATLATLEVLKAPWDAAVRPNDHDPVWLGDTVYFLSDRDYAGNVWSWDPATGDVVQRTFFTEFDCKSLASGGGALIFENGGWLWTLAPEGGEPRRLEISVRGDFPWARPHWEKVGEEIRTMALSSTGKRAVVEARGEIFTIPAEKGDIRNLSRDSGAADRDPVWSPDGTQVAWFSDAGGEYRLVVTDQVGGGRRDLELPGPTFFYDPAWSPDGARIAYTDADRVLWVLELASGRTTRVDVEGFAHPERLIRPAWSPDSRWLAYSRRLHNQYNAVFVYDVVAGEAPRQVTDGLADNHSPVFDHSGKYLWFLGSTDYGLAVGWLDMSSIPVAPDYSVYLAVLADDEPNPLAPESDDETKEDEKATKDEPMAGDDEAAEKAEAAPKPVRIDFAGLDRRILALDLPARQYGHLRGGADGTVFFTESIPDEDGLTLHRYSLEKRKDQVVMAGIAGFALSADGQKLLYGTEGDQYGIVDAGGEAKVGDGAIATSELAMFVDPAAEWRQIFSEALRFQRDYFYVDTVHGLDLAWAERSYGAWLDSVRHRDDLTYLLDILGGETSIGHSFVGGGDTPDIERVPVGLLGADLEADQGRWRLARIFTGESWNPQLKAPLSGPGLDVRPGEYVLAVDGRALTADMNPYRLFDRTAGRQTVLTIGTAPTLEGARQVTVVPVASEVGLRTRAWVEDNRRRVDELSGGRLAYVWLPDTGNGGFSSFNRYLFAQQDKQGAVIDERFNHGGSIADYIVDLLSRQLYGYFSNPVGERQPWTAPNATLWGPKVLVINESAGSGGDMLPYMFRARGIGPLVGTRTWGGLVGIWDVPDLIDGGYITAPRGGFYDRNGEWAVENEGVPPDVEVEQDPKAVAAGGDPQLEKAVEVALELLETQAVTHPPQPPDPIRVRRPQPRP